MTVSDEIRAFWTSASERDTDADGLRPTARDPYLQEAVEWIIEGRLAPGQRVIDVGCGDGSSTLRFARRVASVVGIDYIEGFVRRAQHCAAAAGIDNVAFETGSVLDLASERARHEPFDVAITIRCLINLSTATEQARALGEIARMLRPGGLYLASEGWSEGMDGLNTLRRRAGLPAIATAPYNRLLRREEFESEANRYFDLVDYVGLGFYLMLSRLVQPLFTAPNPPEHGHRLNEIAAELERCCGLGRHFDSCDYAGVYVLRRKSDT